ncbi:hypothetical protein [Yoonia vestfoldensis]|jgi:hypothetical protein|uniref:Uncharacterized protein n=1 Tax=Yoonia vestfoldensis TaxID=245188 RepID=A0A1Y0E7R1_9RHOB|nr:hypothetical protein [Yoonia vestfoldensis]ART99635.1 hypothetical protein LOKVESSMR4R_00295 [Yoonia vestfoldensis]
MFGWLRKRERREHIKLLKQNVLAAQYLSEFQSQRLAMDPSADTDFLSTLKLAAFSSDQYLFDLESYRLMDPDRFNEQYGANKNFRRLYDQILYGRKAFARQFGKAAEKLEPFDQKFQPNEGWDIFLERFPTSMEERFKGQ